MLPLFLIILYSILSVFLLLRASVNLREHLSARQVTISFIIKILFGMAYGFIFLHFYNGDDTWKYHQASLEEYQNLIHHPLHFLQDTFSKGSGKLSLDALYDTRNSYWDKIDEILFIKMLAVFNVFSFGYYYVNVVLFCFIVYFGNLFLFRLMLNHFPGSSRLLMVLIFFMPVVIFWLSGIRKDGLLFVALAASLHYFDGLMRREKAFIIKSVLFLTAFAVLCLIRNFMAMCLIPALTAWFLCRVLRYNAVAIFSVVYILSIGGFFLTSHINGIPDLPQKVANRQYDFLELTAKTRLPLDSLHASGGSYLSVLPQAINHSFMRPYITESKGMLQVFSAVDVIFFMSFLLLATVFYDRKAGRFLRNPVVLTCLFTSFFGYLLIGYTVPFPGAIVRYKVIFELLFLCVFAIVIDKNRFKIAYINLK